MKRITSTEFQKSYSRLTEPHEVTALGRVIGMWTPATSRIGYDEDHQAGTPPSFNPAPKPKVKR